MDKISKAQRQKGVSPFIIVVILMILLIGIAVARYLQPSIQAVEVARFYNNAQAAYSIIHDDLCMATGEGILTQADTIAYNRGIRFAAGAVVSYCHEGGDSLWERVQTLVDHGHEIASHSWSHGPAIDISWKEMFWSHDSDVVTSKAVLEENLEGAEVSWFIFPYDAYDARRLDEVAAAGFLGARAGDSMYTDRTVNGRLKNFDPMRTNFDIYISAQEQESINMSDNPFTVSIYPQEGENVAIQHIDAAVAVGGWSLQEMHAVADPQDSIWGSITPDEYRRVLDYAVEKRNEGELWVDTPTKVAKYIVTRNGLGRPRLEETRVSFPDQSIRPAYSTSVTMAIHTKHAPKKVCAIIDGEKTSAVKAGDNLFLVQYLPGSTMELSLE